MVRKIISVVVLIPIVLVACIKSGNPPSLTSTSVSLASRVQLGDYQLLAPEDMRADLNELFTKLELTHPNLYANRPKNEVDIDRQMVFDELNQPLTIIDFYLKVAPLVDSLGDKHTRILVPDVIYSKELFFPFDVKFFGQRAAATNYSGIPDIPSKAEILSINGTSIPGLLNELSLYQFSQNSFFITLWLYSGTLPEYQVEFLPLGATTPARYQVRGMTAEAIRTEVNLSAQPLEDFNYQTLPNSDIGVMTINTFNGGPGQYLEEAFTQIKQDHVQHLIIDIRCNEGGMYNQVDSVMAYLTNLAYKQCSDRYERFVNKPDTPPEKFECDLIQPQDRPSRFQGDIDLLIGPDTFSAAITFATILQDYKLATLVGEETEGKASYCAWVSDPITLSHTHLQYTYSSSCYVRPDGINDNKGVIPDVIVRTTIDDYIAGRDPVLAKVIDLIR